MQTKMNHMVEKLLTGMLTINSEHKQIIEMFLWKCLQEIDSMLN